MLFSSGSGSRSRERASTGISAALLALGLTACAASGPRAVRYSTPPPELAPPGNLLATSNEPVSSAPVARQPRVIIPAPPLVTSAPSQPAGANTLVDPYATDAPAGQAATAPAPSTTAPPSAAASQGVAAATPAPAAPTAYVASSVAPPLAGFTPQASPLLAAFDSSPRGQAPAPMDPMVQQMQRRGPGGQGWTPDFRPSYYGGYGGYYGPSYYYGPSSYGRSYGYGGYYGPSYGYGYRPGLGLGIGLGLGFGLGRHSRGWGSHRGHHHGGFFGGRGHRHR